MALGNTEGANTSSISLKLVAPQGETDIQPKFVVKAKNEATGHYELTDEKFGRVAGTVQSIRTSHNGKSGKDEVKGFVACLQDGDERYYIDATMTNASKDIANHLLASVGKSLSVGLYLNNRKYPSASVKLDNGDYAPTALDFKGLDKDELWDAIKAQEATPDEAKEAPAEDLSIEDVPF